MIALLHTIEWQRAIIAMLLATNALFAGVAWAAVVMARRRS